MVRVRGGGREWIFQHFFFIDIEARGPSSAEEQAMITLGDRDERRSAKMAGIGSISPNAGADVFLRPVGEAEVSFLPRFGDFRKIRPGVGRRDALLADLNQEFRLLERVAGHWWRWRSELIARSEQFRGEFFAIDGEVGHLPMKRFAGPLAVAGADDEIGVICHRREIGFAS